MVVVTGNAAASTEGLTEKALDHVSGRIAHDLNDQLVVISGYAKLGQSGAGEPEQTESYFKAISSASQEARSLMDDLKALGQRRDSTAILKPLVWPPLAAPLVGDPRQPFHALRLRFPATAAFLRVAPLRPSD